MAIIQIIAPGKKPATIPDLRVSTIQSVDLTCLPHYSTLESKTRTQQLAHAYIHSQAGVCECKSFTHSLHVPVYQTVTMKGGVGGSERSVLKQEQMRCMAGEVQHSTWRKCCLLAGFPAPLPVALLGLCAITGTSLILICNNRVTSIGLKRLYTGGIYRIDVHNNSHKQHFVCSMRQWVAIMRRCENVM